MNDRVVEARMARLVGLSGGGGVSALTDLPENVAAVPTEPVGRGETRPSGGLLADLLEATALVGRFLAPVSPLRLRVVHR